MHGNGRKPLNIITENCGNSLYSQILSQLHDYYVCIELQLQGILCRFSGDRFSSALPETDRCVCACVLDCFNLYVLLIMQEEHHVVNRVQVRVTVHDRISSRYVGGSEKSRLFVGRLARSRTTFTWTTCTW